MDSALDLKESKLGSQGQASGSGQKVERRFYWEESLPGYMVQEGLLDGAPPTPTKKCRQEGWGCGAADQQQGKPRRQAKGQRAGQASWPYPLGLLLVP